MQVKKKVTGLTSFGIDDFELIKTFDEEKCFYLAAKGSAQEKWLRKFMPPEKILTFRCRKDFNSFFGQKELNDFLQCSNIASIIKKNNINTLLITERCPKYLKDWSRENKIELIALNDFKRQKMEDKIFFDKFLIKHQIRKPKSFIYNYSKTKKLPYSGKIVLQERLSWGGEGSYFINSEDIDKLVADRTIKANCNYLAREFIKGRSYGITLFITSKIIALSSIRLQCYDKKFIFNKKIFLGIQWLPTKQIPEKTLKEINCIFLNLGATLQRDKFYGFTNFDFIVSPEGRPYLLECNPRSSLATPQIIKFPELISRLEAGRIFMNEFAFAHSHSHPIVRNYPVTGFSGSVLLIYSFSKTKDRKICINRDYNRGLYSYKNGSIVFKTFDTRKFDLKQKKFVFEPKVERGECYENTVEAASVFSNFQLFDYQGQLNKNGLSILRHFKY